MYPTLTDFFKKVFNIDLSLPIQTYGFFVVLAFLTGFLFLSIEFKRKEKEGSLVEMIKRVKIGEPASITLLLFSAIISFPIGFKGIEAILNYSDIVANPQDFIFSSRGNFIGGILAATIWVYINWKEKDKQKLDKPKWINKTIYPHELIGNILVIAVISGIMGAKLFHNLENIDELIANPIDSIFSLNGLTFLGGLIVGLTAVLYYIYKNNIPSLSVLDAAAPGLAISYAIGRLGCQISGDGCWGINNLKPKPDWMSFLPDWMWSYTYPNNVINAGRKISNCSLSHCHVLEIPVFPTPFYETIMMLGIFIFLWSIRKKVKTPGIMFASFITLAGFERFIIEQIRINNEYNIFGFNITQAQIISTLMIVLGIISIILFHKKRDKTNEILEKNKTMK